MNDYPPDVLHVSAELLVALLLAGAAVLAAWTMVRFQGFGPRTVGGVLVTSAVAMILVSALPAWVDGVIGAQVPAARLVVSICLVLPVFTYFFIASGWFLRMLVELLDGVR